MKNRIVRLGLVAGIVLTAAAPVTQQAHAWSCTDPVAQVACLAVRVACSAVPDKDIKNVNPRDLCTLS